VPQKSRQHTQSSVAGVMQNKLETIVQIRNTLLLFLVFVFLAGCQTNIATSSGTGLPPTPEGFSWFESTSGVGTFLKPEGWFSKEETVNNTNAVFITKENVEAYGKFTTGMTVNKFNNWSQSNNSKPSQYAAAFAAKSAASGKVLINTIVKGNQDDMHVARVLSDNAGTPTIVHNLAIGIDSKDEVYLIIYESPESDWEANYKQGREMLNFFFLGS
jgi:hypothetical protein